MRARRLLPSAVAGVALSALALGTAGSAGVSAAASTSCPAGTLREKDVSLQQYAGGQRATCSPALKVEPLDETMRMNSELAMRATSGLPVASGAFAAATAAHQAMVASTAKSAPSWVAMGKGPLSADVAGFGEVNGEGLHQLSGRIEDFAYDPASPTHYFAAVANGGIWATTNGGSSWHSVGDRLPTQITGAVEVLRENKGFTLVAGTGDPAYGGSSFAGLGLYWSIGNGSWTRSKGVPSGALTFSMDHDPARPRVVYAATSKGLYRSTDAARSFTNVVLPTGCTNVSSPICYFANMVTDVLVRPVGRGNEGGAVLAAVGWRAGAKPNAVGKPQSPHNGLYLSSTGKPKTFRFLSNPKPAVPGTGFATDDVVGRVALGGATGSSQDHGYVYAVVQDAQKFNGAATAFDLPEPTGVVPGNTVLNGIYGSKDFGLHWTKLADAAQLAMPGSGTALNGADAATYAPGVQSWYNEWVQVDPTVQSEAGVPGRIAFGLEEIWTGAGALPPAPDTGEYHVVGKYFAGSVCGGYDVGAILGTTDAPCPLTATLTDPSSAVANQGLTTHPDQHGGLFVPQANGGVALLAGNDGGAYKQTLPRGGELTNAGWGKGINNGFNTLLPYDVSLSSDGVAVMGLQDNGSAVITPEGRQIMAFGGDGFFVAIDPARSNVWYEEYVGGAMSKTTDGGKSWTGIDPGLTSPLFSTPFVMDLTDSRHLVIGGRDIKETKDGAGTWTKVFDLGTQQHPGDASAGTSPLDSVPVVGNPLGSSEINNQMSAVDTRGDSTYVGFCGYCDIVTGGVPFNSGIATNVGGDKAPKAGTSNGWHVVAAKGLPKRIVNSVSIDPANPRTVYVTLGGYGRRWIPPGSLGDSVSKVGRGHVFRSTDAGKTFTDISGNLPDIGADDAIVFNGALVVSTDLGVYIGDTRGKHFQVLGRGLPAAPVFRVNHSPRSPRELVVASYGRGAYRITVPAGYAGQPAKVRSVYGESSASPSTLTGATRSGAVGGAASKVVAGRTHGQFPAVVATGSAPSVAVRSAAAHDAGLPAGPVTAAVLLLLATAGGLGLRRRAPR
jgi:photosystem II stability/assembly factor-like uncharacterized protein